MTQSDQTGQITDRIAQDLRERLTREGDHLQVKDVNGEYVGTVDGLEGDRVKLTRSGSHDGQHHYIPLVQVESLDEVAVYLNVSHNEIQ
ncbi:DUF2171 domain-containing protein [Deinococcus hopiensis]|uniref:DUF2171 domain-containing protein n=1 Tax=Deinococcus hopiensis KR-140 TaxID=695939 RepID=A0A1W1VLW7_9DEIO|nr:DUF2171 domain-containing protein [Deinococcus hopiensis]SMB94347.1 hypothetical protein SAMN00790413_02347 [Deinococcus hopiensis KR-140]